MTDDLLSLKYIPISRAELFDNNAKLHNLDQIIQSIRRYGFKSACKWEGKLNDGRGGIVAGNGRVEALRVMEERGDDLPVGIAQDETGEWCVPVLFGVEAESEAIARAYAWDDNLILTGGMLEIDELMKLYDPELLESELESLSRSGESPLSIDFESVENGLQTLIAESQNELSDELEDESDTLVQGERGKNVREIENNYNSSDVRQIVLVLSVEEYNNLIDKLNEIKTKTNINNNTECIQWLVENYVV